VRPGFGRRYVPADRHQRTGESGGAIVPRHLGRPPRLPGEDALFEEP
jgi:hypothetical protein